MKTKYCSRHKLGTCKAEMNPQPLENFYSQAGYPSARCKLCVSFMDKERRRLNPKIRKAPEPYVLPIHKTCSNKKCQAKNPQPIDQFRARGENRNLRRSQCITCEKTYQQTNEFKIRARTRAWQTEFKERRKVKDRHKFYGLSPEKYNEMFEKQNGCCVICSVHASEKKQGLSVDHCHKTGKVRGLLCHNCNRGLGLFKDKIDLFKKAIEYLGDNDGV